MHILSSYDILPRGLSIGQLTLHGRKLLAVKLFLYTVIRQNTAENVIYDNTDDITVLLVLDFNECVKIVKSTDVMSVLLTGDLQRSHTVFQVLLFLHRCALFYKIFTFNAHNPYRYPRKISY